MSVTRLQSSKGLEVEVVDPSLMKNQNQNQNHPSRLRARNDYDSESTPRPVSKRKRKIHQRQSKTSGSKVVKFKHSPKLRISSSSPTPTPLTKSRLSTNPHESSNPHNNTNPSKVQTRLRECTICAELKGKRQFPNVERPSDCGHWISACRACIIQHSIVEIKKHGQLQRIACFDCAEPLKDSYLESLLTKPAFEKIKTLQARQAIESHPRFRSCLRPNCSAGRIYHELDIELIVCTACGAKSCFNHGTPWHKGYTCKRYDASHPNAATSRTSEELLRTTAKKCPGPGCPFYVEKNGGCDLIYCTGCNRQWNWVDVEFGEREVAPMPAVGQPDPFWIPREYGL